MEPRLNRKWEGLPVQTSCFVVSNFRLCPGHFVESLARTDLVPGRLLSFVQVPIEPSLTDEFVVWRDDLADVRYWRKNEYVYSRIAGGGLGRYVGVVNPRTNQVIHCVAEPVHFIYFALVRLFTPLTGAAVRTLEQQCNESMWRSPSVVMMLCDTFTDALVPLHYARRMSFITGHPQTVFRKRGVCVVFGT